MIPHRIFAQWITAWHHRAIGLKAASFAIIGIVNSAVDLGIFSFAYYFLELPILPANAVAWAIAVTGSYVMNSLMTFAQESGRELHFDSYIRFASSQAAGLFANTAAVFIASHYISVLAGKLLAIGASFLINFSLSNFVVFRKQGHIVSSKIMPAWALAVIVVFLFLGAMTATILIPWDVNSTATDISSRSRAMPTK